MREILDELTGLEARQLHDRTVQVGRRSAAGDWEMAACLLAGERCGLHLAHNFSSMVRYAAETLDMEPQRVGELLRAARALEPLERLSAAFRAGTLSWSKIRELTRFVKPETEEAWLEFALVSSAEQIRREGAQSPRAHRRGTQPAARPKPSVTEDLIPEGDAARPESKAGQPVEGVTPGSTQAEPAPPVPPAPRPPARGRKLVRVTHYMTAEEFAVYEQGMNRIRTQLRGRVRHEAVLAEAFRQILAATPARKRLRHQVILHVDGATGEGFYETSRGRLPASEEAVADALRGGEVALLSQSPAVSGPAAAEQLLLEPGKSSRPKSLPRTAVTQATLQALFGRAQGRCESRGCGQAGFLHVHHRRPWSEGGTNELENLELLCSGCHALGHRSDYARKPGWSKARNRRQARKRARAG